MKHRQKIDDYLRQCEGKSAEEILAWSLRQFSLDQVALASSFGAEDQVLTDMIFKINAKARMFTLDTGRLPQETYDVMTESMKRYDARFEVLFPKREQVEKLVAEKGPNSFYESVENRKECCLIRKVEPLRRKLSTLSAWVVGLRKQQAVTRQEMKVVEWDEGNQLIKVSPLIDWSEKDVWNYLRKKNVPYNQLHDQNYPSIGCAPCTRGIQAGEDVRAGRWWWEQPEDKECGLHFVDGKLMRVKETL